MTASSRERTEAAPSGDGVASADHGVRRWRRVLARRLALLASVVNAVGTVVAVILLSGESRAEIAIGGCIVAALLLIALRRRLPERTRGWLLVAASATSAVTGYATLGFLGGPASALSLTLLVAALLLGPRAAAATLVAAAVGIAVVGWAIISGVLPVPSRIDASPTSPAAWVRTAGVSLLLSGVGAAVITWVVRQLESSIERVRREEARRREAEDARRKAEHMAVESQKLELIGRLAAGLAHDFNNHLTVVAMAHGRLADPRADATARRDASRAIMDSIRSAGALSRQLLVLGRSAPRNLVDVALADVVDAFLPSLERVLPSDVSFEVIHGEPAVVRADETQLQQALLNFVVNARDAMPDGGKLTVRTRRVTLGAERDLGRSVVPPGRWAVLEVEDSGAGIPDAVRDRVFEPFFTTKPLDQGSGLGLATVSMMAEEAGGHVELQTAIGRGTRIALWLPAVAARAREATPTSTPVPSAPSFAGRVALVVEDEPLLLEAAVRVLADAGCRVLSARDGTAALAVLDQHQGPIDLLCTDVVMPGAPVRDVIARFRELHPSSPVLTCSGYVGEDLVRRGIEEGRYRLLPKPYTADDLLDAVTAVLRSPSARRRAG